MSLFIVIALSLYAVLNLYLLWHIRNILLTFHLPGLPIAWIIIAWMLAYPAGRIIEAYFRSTFSSALIYAGAYFLGFLVLSLAGLLAGDIVRLVSLILPDNWLHTQSAYKVLEQYWRVGVLSFAVLGMIIGHFNARTLRVRKLDIEINKQVPTRAKLRIVMASDIHLGMIINTRRLAQIVATINRQKPDVVLLVGDVVDEDVDNLMEPGMAPEIAKIKAPLGVYAVTGNHEFISGNPQLVEKYLGEAGVTMLEDDLALIEDAFYIVGRTDRSAHLFTGVSRLPLNQLLEPLDHSKPIILMDHQPFGLEEAENSNVDLQVSGHTHHGQIWPLNYITQKLYEQSWGYLRKGNTQYYVSCGVGTWGPPIRLGSVPEVVRLDLEFKTN